MKDALYKNCPYCGETVNVEALNCLRCEDALLQGTTIPWQSGTYRGQLNNHEPHGFGTLLFADSSYYKVNWVNGKKHGFGTFVWSTGTRYDGGWINDRRNGNGKISWPDGKNFEGVWVYGKRNGFGTLTWPDGTTYKGQWKNDLKHGQGSFIWPDGSVYDGEWAAGKRCGLGTLTWPDGTTYKGQWTDDLKHGQGSFIWPDGKIYVGEWAAGKRCELGTLTWPDGTTYKGQWKDDLKHGQGSFIWPDGSVYDGEWSYDKKCGYGSLTWPDGTVYKGQWKDKFDDGWVILAKPDGSKLMTRSKNGNKQGCVGLLYRPAGIRYNGQYKANKWLSARTEVLDSRLDKLIKRAQEYRQQNNYSNLSEIGEELPRLLEKIVTINKDNDIAGVCKNIVGAHLDEKSVDSALQWISKIDGRRYKTSSIINKLNKIKELTKEHHIEEINDAFTLRILGKLHKELNSENKALIIYVRSLDFEPKSIYGLNGAGGVCRQAKWPDLAIEYYEKALSIIENTVSFTGLGAAYRNLGEHNEALLNYSKALELDEKDAYANNGIGAVYFDLGNYEAGEQHFATAGMNKGHLLELSKQYKKDGRIEKAIKCLELILKDYPEDNETQMILESYKVNS